MKNFVARRPWYARLLRFDAIAVTISDVAVDRAAAGHTDSTPLESIEAVNVAAKWYGSRLQVVSRVSAIIEWPLLNHQDAERIAASITAALHGPDCRSACANFKSMLTGTGYLNNKRVLAWVENHSNVWLRVANLNALATHLPTG